MLADKRNRIRDEKINGEIFDMSPAPNFRHSVVNGKMFSKKGQKVLTSGSFVLKF